MKDFPTGTLLINMGHCFKYFQIYLAESRPDHFLKKRIQVRVNPMYVNL